jgi:hypothetical protein
MPLLCSANSLQSILLTPQVQSGT